MKIIKRAAAIMLAVSLFCAMTAALEADTDTVYPGIDVSAYQGNIDFSRVREDGIAAVYIKAGQGENETDPYFLQNYEDAREAGLKVGFYYYVTARDAAQAAGQARAFAALLRGKAYDMRPAMDFEAFSGLHIAAINEIGSTFLEELTRLTGKTPVLYTDAYAAERVWEARFAKYPLWIADYSTQEPPDNGKWSGWAGFQYSDKGGVAGIATAVDLDRFASSVLLDNAPQPMPEETVYIVRAGDTLWAIARRYGVSIASIAERNGIADPNLINIGERLLIPLAGSGGETMRRYTVRAGDTLWAIALRFQTTVSALVRENGIQNANLIYPGQELIIPAG